MPETDAPTGSRGLLSATVRERHIEASNANETRAVVSDLGEGGMFVEMENPPPKGTILDIEFALPGRTERTRVLGIVRWREMAGQHVGAGVRFAPIGDDERQTFARLVRQEKP